MAHVKCDPICPKFATFSKSLKNILQFLRVYLVLSKWTYFGYFW